MLDNTTFYHKTTQKIIVMFGDLFNNMTIRRRDASSNIIQEIKIPILYGPKEKWLTVAGTVNSGVSIVYPRMAFQISSFSYDPERKGITTQKLCKIGDTNTVLKRAWNSVPYDIGITLSIISRFTEDGLKIIEQIIPFFRPSFTISMNWIPELNMQRDIPIILNSVSPDNAYEMGQDSDNKLSTWDLDFTIKADYLGAITNQNVILKSISQVYANTYSDYSSSTIYEDPQSDPLELAVGRYIVEPSDGSTANNILGYDESWERRNQ